MTGYKSKKAAAQDKVVVTDLDGHVVRGVQKSKKVAALDRDAEIERLNEKIEFLARTNMLYSDWEHRDTQVTSELIRKGIEEHKINAELRAEIERLKEALAKPAQEPTKYSFKAHWEEDGCIGVVAAIERLDGGVHLLKDTIDAPQRPWVDLTDGVMCDIAIKHGLMSIDWIDFARDIEAALRSKNT